MSKIKTLLYILSLLIAVSCGSAKDSSMLWGETTYYEDFLFKKYKPVRMSRTISYEFNDDAKRLAKDVKLGIYAKTEDGKFIPVKEDIRLYKNGEECSGNAFVLSPKHDDDELELGIEFTPTARKGMHKWYLKIVDNGSLDRINEYSTSEDMLPLLLEWRAEKDVATNPLLLGCIIVLVALVALILIWLLIIKPQMYDSFKVRTLYVTCEGAMIPARLIGAKRVICTSKRCSQSFINQFFEGKSVYVISQYFALGDVLVTPKGRDGARVKGTKDYAIFPNVVTTREPITMKYTSDSSKTAEFKIQ
ncbi:MAG: hypothetical protein SNH35_03060 [Rikenellaceae bacterium]